MSHGVCLSRVLHFSAVFLSASSLVFPVSPAQTEGTIKRQADTSQVVRLPFSFFGNNLSKWHLFSQPMHIDWFFLALFGLPTRGTTFTAPHLDRVKAHGERINKQKLSAKRRSNPRGNLHGFTCLHSPDDPCDG